MKRILFAVILGSLILPMSSLAESNKDYYGISVGESNIKDLTTKDTWSPYAIGFRGVAYVGDYVALEARFTAGTGPDEVRVSGSDTKLTLVSAASFFVKADLPLQLHKSVNIYGLLGLTKAKVKGAFVGFPPTYTDNHGFSYGLGVEMPIDRYWFVNGEYVNYFKGADFEYSGFNIGFTKLWD
jgi:opacity protein-like surface antigen